MWWLRLWDCSHMMTPGQLNSRCGQSERTKTTILGFGCQAKQAQACQEWQPVILRGGEGTLVASPDG